MKRFYKLFACWVFVLLLVFSPNMQSHASLESLLIRTDSNALMVHTDSNALMTLELDDSDYSVMPLSSFGTVTNTVDMNHVYFAFYVKNPATGADYTINKQGSIVENGKRVVLSDSEILEGYYINNIQFYLNKGALPPAGTYSLSFDWANQFSFELGHHYFIVNRVINNASMLNDTFNVDNYISSGSGDIYLGGLVVDLKNITQFGYYSNINFYDTDKLRNFDGVLSVGFAPSSATPVVTLGTEISSSEYQSDVSSSLSDLSSSVDTMTDGISGVTEAIQNLQGAMEPHYSNVLTQLHHITEQLHAFYDQVYNNIHLPEMDMLTQIRNTSAFGISEIKTAIENLDLQIEVDISEVKTAINNMSTAVQNKLQSTTDQITGGYDNSGMSSDKNELDGVLDQYEQAEEDLFDDAQGHINDFEFNTPLDSFTGPLTDVSYFLNGMFEAMGPMNVVISFSLTLTIAMVMIGWYRFKGGR